MLTHLYTSTYGIVYKAQNKVNGTYVAIKKFKDSDDDEYVSKHSDEIFNLILTFCCMQVRKTALREIRILK